MQSSADGEGEAGSSGFNRGCALVHCACESSKVVLNTKRPSGITRDSPLLGHSGLRPTLSSTAEEA